MTNKIAVIFAASIVVLTMVSYGLASGAPSLQYAPRMRYSDNIITYRINDCPRYKWVDIERAFNKISAHTPLTFLPALDEEQIVVNCSPDLDKAEEGEKYGVRELGKGGPRYSVGDKYNIIMKGEVLIEKDHDCEEPLVEIHEILHAMGYAHSDDKTSIMYPMLDCSQEIKREIVDDITMLYLDTSLPDLEIKKLTLGRERGLYKVTAEIFNNGIVESKEARLVIRDREKGAVIKALTFPPLKPGTGIIQTLTTDYRINSVEVELEAGFEEIEKDNNKKQADLE